MRFWHIIAVSIFAATIVAELPYLPPVADLTAILFAQWPVIVVLWFGSYGLAAAVLAALASTLKTARLLKGIPSEVAWGDRNRVPPRQLWRQWSLQYFKTLAITQYFTTVTVLLSLGLSHIPVQSPRFVSIDPVLTASPALAACGAVVIVGLLGVLTSVVPLLRAVSRHAIEPPEPLLLSPTVELLRAPTSTPTVFLTSTDTAELSTMIEQSQRPTLEAIKNLAIAINKVGRGQRQVIQEIKTTLAEGVSGQPTESSTASPTAMEHTTTELRATLAALDASISKLTEVASLLSMDEAALVMQRSAATSPASLSQLSSEFQKLLHEIGGTIADKPGDDPTR